MEWCLVHCMFTYNLRDDKTHKYWPEARNPWLHHVLPMLQYNCNIRSLQTELVFARLHKSQDWTYVRSSFTQKAQVDFTYIISAWPHLLTAKFLSVAYSRNTLMCTTRGRHPKCRHAKAACQIPSSCTGHRRSHIFHNTSTSYIIIIMLWSAQSLNVQSGSALLILDNQIYPSTVHIKCTCCAL